LLAELVPLPQPWQELQQPREQWDYRFRGVPAVSLTILNQVYEDRELGDRIKGLRRRLAAPQRRHR
jgi:hypothetical protein